MHEVFLSIWKKRKHVSQVSGTYLGREPKTYMFHHIFAKSKYMELAYEEDNIILLTADEHASVELNSTKYEVINELREQLKTKYKIK